MTERFIVIDDGLDFMVRDTITGDDLIDADGVAEVLNDYEKENKELKELIVEQNRQYLKLKRQQKEKEIFQLKNGFEK